MDANHQSGKRQGRVTLRIPWISLNEAAVVALLAPRPLAKRPPDLVAQAGVRQFLLGGVILRRAPRANRPGQPLGDDAIQGAA